MAKQKKTNRKVSDDLLNFLCFTFAGANDILDSLEKERNLFVMRQNIPNTFDAFGSDVRKDLVEHWDNEKLDDWRGGF